MNAWLCSENLIIVICIFQGIRYPSWTVLKFQGLVYLVALTFSAKTKLLTLFVSLGIPAELKC